MRNLALPCVLLVMGAIAVACESGPATSPNSEVLVPQLNLLTPAVAGCPAGFDLVFMGIGSDGDRNEDGFICQKTLASLKVVISDNRVPLQLNGCPVGTTLTLVGLNPAAQAADKNYDGIVCVNGGGNLFTDNVIINNSD